MDGDELEIGADLAASPRFNEDIAPTKVAQRTWNTWHIAALWVGMAICVPKDSGMSYAWAMNTLANVQYIIVPSRLNE